MRRSLILWPLLGIGRLAQAAAIARRDADFLSVRTHMLKDMSGRAGDPKEKYFHESIFHPHYDGRYARPVVIGRWRRRETDHARLF